MSNRIATIGRYTVLEALRTRLVPLALTLAVVMLASSFFVREIAIADSGRFQTAFYAAGVRFGMVFIIALHVIASVSREFQDKGLDVVLALDLPRSHYVAGKLCGFIAIAVAAAIVAGAPLAWLAGWASAAQWSVSLALELALVAALSLFCVLAFTSIMPAASIVGAFYLLARAITTIRLISANPIEGADAPSHWVMHALVEGLALIIPPLDSWTRTQWLVDAVGSWNAVASIAAHAALFVAIVTAAAVFDLHRRNF